MNKYICFVTNYFCFYCVRVTNVQMHTLNEKNLKVHSCKFENFPLRSDLHENVTLKFSHS